jgi:hypothetical protein
MAFNKLKLTNEKNKYNWKNSVRAWSAYVSKHLKFLFHTNLRPL